MKMPKKRISKTVSSDSRELDDDFFFDDSQSCSGRSSQEPPQRNAANARERARMRVLSKAFCRLKTTLPWVPADTKLSKLDTLRLAASYIAHLRALLHEPRSGRTSHPLNLAWPFAFQHGGTLSCTMSQKRNMNNGQETNHNLHQNRQGSREIQNDCTNNFYDNEYEEMACEEINPQKNECTQIYCNYYGYKNDPYYERNTVSTEIGNV